jgi:hypothetical protein
LATRVQALVLERSGEAPSLAVVLSLTTDLIEGHIDVAVSNRVHWVTRLVLTAVLSHFLDLVLELELLGSGYNADLAKDEMEVFQTRTCWALESLSSRVHLSVAHSLLDGTWEE